MVEKNNTFVKKLLWRICGHTIHFCTTYNAVFFINCSKISACYVKDVFRPYFISEIVEWTESEFGFEHALSIARRI